MKKVWVLFSLFVLLGLLAGQALALTVQRVMLEYSHDFGWQNYTKLVEPDPHCEECIFYAPLDDFVNGTTTVYERGVAKKLTVVGDASIVPGLAEGNAIEFTLLSYLADSGLDTTTITGVTVTAAVKGTYFNSTEAHWPDIVFVQFDSLTWSESENLRVEYQLPDGKIALIYEDAKVPASSSVVIPVNLTETYKIVASLDFTTRELKLTLIDSRGNVLTSSKVISDTLGLPSRIVKVRVSEEGSAYDAYNDVYTIDEVRVFGRVLSSAEIDLLLHLGRYRYALYRGDEPSLPSYLNATLFCPLDDLDTTANTTTCYLNDAEQSVSVIDPNTTDSIVPKLVGGVIENAFFNGNATTDLTYIRTTATLVGYANISLSVAIFFKWNGVDSATRRESLIENGYTSNGLLLFPEGHPAFAIANTHTISSTKSLRPGVWYLIVGVYNYQTGEQRLIVYNAETMEKYDEISTFIGQVDVASTYPNVPWQIGGRGGASGSFDEARVWYNYTLTDSDILRLLYINRYKFATLSAPGASFNGTHFLVNVTASLPADGGSYLLPAPVNATGSYSSAGQIGNFTFFDVGTASSATYQLPAEPGKAVPGLRELAIETDEGIYAYGTGSYTLKVPKSTMYLATNTISGGKVTNVAWSGVSTLKKLDVPLTVQSGDGVITVNNVTPELIDLTAQSITNPVKISAKNLLPYADYNVLHNDNKVATFTPDDQGVGTFEISATGNWLIGVTQAVWDSVSSNVIRITFTVILIAIFAMMVVERTPAKFDDNVVKAMITMIVIAVLIGLIKLIMLLK